MHSVINKGKRRNKGINFMVREEVYRVARSPWFWAAVALGFVLLIPGALQYNEGPKDVPGMNPALYNVYEAFMWAEKAWLILFVPVLATLPFADSYALDRVSGYLRAVLMRASYRRYLLTKLVTNLLAGGLALALPLALFFLLSHFFFATDLPSMQEARMHPTGPASSIYWEQPALFIFFLIAVAFVFGAVYATLGLAISFWTANRYVVLATPFVLYHTANFILGIAGLARWTPPMTFYPVGVSNSTWLSVFGELALIFVASLAAIALKANKELATLDKENE